MSGKREEKSKKKSKKITGIVKRMVSYLTKFKLLLVGSFLGALISTVFGLLGPVFIGKAVDAILRKGSVDFSVVFINMLWFLVSTLLFSGFQWVTLLCTRTISANCAQDMRRDAFARLNLVPLKMIDSYPHGDIVNRLVNDIDAISEGYLQGLSQLFPGILTILFTIIVMFILNPAIAVMVIIATPLSILFAKFVTRKTGKLFVTQSESQGKVSAYVREMVENQNLVKAFHYEEKSEEAFQEVNQEYYSANFKATFYSSVINPGARFINAIVYAAVGVMGSILAVGGSITIGGVSAFLAYANQYTKPFNEVSAVLTQLQAAYAGARRIFDVIDWPEELPDAPDALDIKSSHGEVRAQHVFFSYQKERPLIQDFSIQTDSGQRVALVGPTGCGKTTIINLLMRFYEVEAGAISVDSTPIVQIKRDALRGLFGMVLQDTWLKHATVRENIAYCDPDASIDEVTKAAKSAYAHNFIMRLPNGYETEIESGGGNLSAGQKQLLCIARIMLAKPDIFILDEATSSIDTRTEMLIQKALEKLMRGRTSFIVAHRLSTIQNADKIIVMDAGKIVEQGNHETLLAKRGFYYDLYHSQFVADA